MKHILLSAMLLIFSANAQETIPPVASSDTQSNATTQIHSSYTTVEKDVRRAAVKVVTPQGHGSGSLIKYKDMTLVLTAQHVADGELGSPYLVRTENEAQLAVLIHADPLNDIAVLFLTAEFEHAKPMKWKTKTAISKVGEEITYSGYPSWHSLLSFRGSIAGYELIPGRGQQIILQTYGYFGSSGSVIYDDEHNIVGVLWGVDVQRDGVHENIVWVSPIQNLDIKLALRPLCIGLADKPRACR
tara:strand:- start:414 stop:1145 length:732 start_codon:yes stop_codon:yes gene_type:complete